MWEESGGISTFGVRLIAPGERNFGEILSQKRNRGTAQGLISSGTYDMAKRPFYPITEDS